MNIISIDFSKVSTGIYAKYKKVEASEVIKIKPKTTQKETLRILYANFYKRLIDKKYDFGLIEGYAFNPKNRRGLIPMSEIGGVIRLAFSQTQTPLVTIHVQIWKMLIQININKNKQKKKYIAAIKTKYDKSFDTVDQADAFLIYQAARIIAKRTTNITPAMRKAKDKLIKIIEVYNEKNK